MAAAGGVGAGEDGWPERFDAQERRLRALEDEREVRRTLHQYSHAIDYGLDEVWLDCFTEDAAWSWSVRDQTLQDSLRSRGMPSVPIGEPGARPALVGDVLERAVVGHDQLRAMVGAHTRAPQAWHKHGLMNVEVVVDGDRADAQSYFVRVDASGVTTGAFIRAFGRYVDELVRCGDGRWRIMRRHCELEAHVDEGALIGDRDR